MEWIVIEKTDLNHYLADAQVSALQTAALGSGQTDPFDEAMPAISVRLRAMIAAGDMQVSSTEYAIPPEIKDIAAHLILEVMQTRLVGLILTDEQKRIIDRGWKYMNDIARGIIPVAEPDDPIDPDMQNGPQTMTVVHSRTTKWSREQTDGL